MNKLKRSWTLFKASLKVLKANKKLLLFPMITSCFYLLIIAFFITPVLFQNTGYEYSSSKHWQGVMNSVSNLIVETNPKYKNTSREAFESTTRVISYLNPVTRSTSRFQTKPMFYVIAVSIYLFAMFLATFFNVAFYNEILNALNGNKVSIRRGLKFALSKIPQIFVWSLFAGIIGVLIKKLEESFGIFGRWLVGLIGITWSIASVFAIPVIIRENKSKNPIKYLRKSASILKSTWGESLAGYIGINIMQGIFTLVLAIPLIVCIIIGGIGSIVLIGLALLAWLISLVILHYILNVANHVYRCALYIYASEGIIPESYNQQLLDTAWKLKTGRKKTEKKV